MKFRHANALLAAALGTIIGCQPSDRNPISARDRVLRGEAVVFSKLGDRLCGPNSAWTEMRIYDSAERPRIVLGQQRSTVQPGHAVCYQVGDVVNLREVNRQVRDAGRARIDRITLVLMDKLRTERLNGDFFASSNQFQAYAENVRERLSPEDQGIVTIVDFTYLAGSASDEKTIQDLEAEKPVIPEYEETKSDGQRLSGDCGNSVWQSLSFPPELISNLEKGLGSWFLPGAKNCFRQGQDADLTNGFKGPRIRRVKVTGLKRFRVSDLKPEHFHLPSDFGFEILREQVSKAKIRDGFMTVVDFQLIPAQEKR